MVAPRLRSGRNRKKFSKLLKVKLVASCAPLDELLDEELPESEVRAGEENCWVPAAPMVLPGPDAEVPGLNKLMPNWFSVDRSTSANLTCSKISPLVGETGTSIKSTTLGATPDTMARI